MDLLILFGLGFIGLMIILLGFLMIAVRKVTGPTKELEEKVKHLEEKLKDMKR